MKIIFTLLFTLFASLSFVSVSAWNSENPLVKIEVTDTTGAKDYAWVSIITNSKNELLSIQPYRMGPKYGVMSDRIEGTKSFTYRFLVFSLAKVKSKNFSKKTGGQLKIEVKGKIFANRKARIIPLELKLNPSSEKWEARYGKSVLASVNLSIDTKLSDLAEIGPLNLKIPKVKQLSLSLLNCNNGFDYATWTDNYEAFDALDCQ